MTLLAVVPSPSSSYDDGDDDVGRCSPHHIQAQRLNNTAATCIEIGNELRERGGRRRGRGQQQKYEQAISILAKALRICEREEEQEHHHAYDVCSCHYCSIDGCIDINDDDTVITEDNNDGTILYQNPVYVYEGHNMASSLIHIISFNLAIVHHLTATKMTMAATTNENENENSNENSNENDKESFINKALQFYELAYECNLAANTDCSIRFDMILCNNLSHIYRYQEQTEVQNEQQQQQPPTNTGDDNDNDNENNDSIGLDIEELLKFEYYSQEEEQEEYKDNTSLISLLTTVSSTA
mmetsp:Transcript_14282/g.15650  ORF Transcript_14282/g.15650 Transcript_14282/m.15650 type:complete len:298 (-) Transcript_14282:136-1029(-)